MARAATRPGPPTLLFGVFGGGESSAENTTALLDDYIEAQGKVTPRFLFALDKEVWTDSQQAIVDYAIEKGYDYDVVYQTTPRTRDLKAVLDKAAISEKAEGDDAPLTQDILADTFLGRLFTAKESQLLFLWLDDADGNPDEYDQRVLTAAGDNGIVLLDVLNGLDHILVDGNGSGGDEPDPEDTGDGDGDGNAGGEDEGPTIEEISEWPERRIREYAKECELDEAVADKVGKDDLLAWIKGDLDDIAIAAKAEEPEDGGKAAEAPARGRRRGAAAKDEGDEAQTRVTPERAREIREEVEKEKPTSRRRGKTDPEPETEPEPPTGEDTGETAVDRLRDALTEWAVTVNDDADGADEAFVAVADALADVIIDRIAARIEREPETSEIRKEIAPPRPPGKPRKDGAAPVRRETAPTPPRRRRSG